MMRMVPAGSVSIKSSFWHVPWELVTGRTLPSPLLPMALGLAGGGGAMYAQEGPLGLGSEPGEGIEQQAPGPVE